MWSCLVQYPESRPHLIAAPYLTSPQKLVNTPQAKSGLLRPRMQQFSKLVGVGVTSLERDC